MYRFLTEGPADAAQCCAATGIPAEQVASALAELAEYKLIRPTLEDRAQWEAVSPDTAIAETLAPMQTQVHNLTRWGDQVRRTLGSFDSIYHDAYRKRHMQSSTEVICGGDQVRQRLADLANQAQNQVLAVHPTMAPIEVLRAGSDLDRSLLERGINYRVVWPHSARRQTEAVQYMRMLQDLGGEVRTAAMPPSRMILLDGEVALVPLPAQQGPGAGILRDPVVLDFLKQIFEHVWQQAQPVSSIEYDDAVFEQIELAILSELALGKTDEAIARRLAISTRTLRRYLNTLFERLDIETRFQLGLAAARSNLVKLPGSSGDPEAD
ncbi:LuxR C-terminal-related transcriptional regulator [Lentzea sp. NBRC 105346]|uniref:helix-turn-helix transcriptional regulator n=1 Tax=Lentzea sp. NBRC 105346 TaxID=3032205 RepID=UPI0025558601|nr:LuxR C-terminal-related transcriptional regulator [Lentzea sp. NBRC 105346]